MSESFPAPPATLLLDLRALIEHARGRVAQQIANEQIRLYWQIGQRLREEVLGGVRADYGERVVTEVARQLTAEFGRGFSRSNLYYMIKFSEVFPEQDFFHARGELSWTHLRELIAIDDPLKRQFYTELCRMERWSTRALKDKINGMLFERTAIAKQPDAVISQTLGALGKEGKMTPDLIFRDPYILDFLRLPHDFAETDLEAAILRDLEAFLLELGSGFSFVARQKRMSIGPDDFYLDLLFFHRPLRALVAIELKLGRFDARDKGQMELYLRWLDRHERQPNENAPLGLILCADKNEEQIELLELDHGAVRVASYLTELPPRELLERKLIESIERAHAAHAVSQASALSQTKDDKA